MGAKPRHFAGGALDFAGGTVVHISSGVSALICALLLGKRLGFGSEPMPPHNMTYTAIGAALLWVGWFGFNAGSALKADGLAASAFAVTHLGAAPAAMSWACIEWIAPRQADVAGRLFGRGGGPGLRYARLRLRAAHVRHRAWAWRSGWCAIFACTCVKSKFGYDDSLDAFGVHGVGGTLGALLTGHIRHAGDRGHGASAIRPAAGPTGRGIGLEGADRRRR